METQYKKITKYILSIRKYLMFGIVKWQMIKDDDGQSQNQTPHPNPWTMSTSSKMTIDNVRTDRQSRATPPRPSPPQAPQPPQRSSSRDQVRSSIFSQECAACVCQVKSCPATPRSTKKQILIRAIRTPSPNSVKVRMMMMMGMKFILTMMVIISKG